MGTASHIPILQSSSSEERYHFVADPRPTGRSIFRIYRDTRFSEDKTPYKTWAALQFRHEAAKDVHAPGFYLHLEPKNVFAGVGIWHVAPFDDEEALLPVFIDRYNRAARAATPFMRILTKAVRGEW